MQPVEPIMPDIPNTLVLIRHGGGKAEGKWIYMMQFCAGIWSWEWGWKWCGRAGIWDEGWKIRPNHPFTDIEVCKFIAIKLS